MVVDADSLGGPDIVLSLRALDGHARTPILLVASGEPGAIAAPPSPSGRRRSWSGPSTTSSCACAPAP